ncbi:DHH family phosphoesterase [Candidatus Woesearchaeota archaeon]|nr:DHH family phosphoesterase [Candidatus Woesearchaeota archaeon]
MITEKQLKEIKDELDHCKKPIFFFHDDPDGLCSFLLMYKYKKEGKGVVVKAIPELNAFFAKKVLDYSADKVFVLDIARVDESFYDMINVPIIWVDHHDVIDVPSKIKYYNPRVKDPDEYSPVSYWVYEALKENEWIAAAGCIGDFFFPPFIDKIKEQFPDLVPKDVKDMSELKYKTKLGDIVRIFSFIMKGSTTLVMNCVKIITRIEDPKEILEAKTSRAKYIKKHFDKINTAYKELLKDALKQKRKGKIFLYKYEESKISLTKDLADELASRYPNKFVIVGREKSGELKMSLRYSKKSVPLVLEKALVGLQGYGGGHEDAGGACVAVEDLDIFLKRIEEEL